MHRTQFYPKEVPEALRDCFEEVEVMCGAPWVRQIERQFKASGGDRTKINDSESDNGWEGTPRGTTGSTTIGWSPSCSCPDNVPVPATVLDPFLGSGTTSLVAEYLGRDSIGIDLNPEYAEMARGRIRADLGRVKSDQPEREAAGPLFET